jgi:uncharacterized protein (DUF2252 family)
MAVNRQPLTVAERMDRGREARRTTPRSSHADWIPAPDRADPIAVLQAQAATRVPELVPIRHGRMLASPFAFYRGAAAIMAADLDGTPVSGIDVQLCGDAHLSNFGIYAAPDRRLVFDLNDFDETHRGPWEWDVKRLAASLEVAARDRGLRPAQRRSVVRASVRAYRGAMHAFADEGNLAVWYARVDVDEAIDERGAKHPEVDLEPARRATAKARRRDSERALAKLTERVDGELRFRDEPPLLVRLASLAGVDEAGVRARLTELMDTFRVGLAPHLERLMAGYWVVDLARKVVGVGSVGTRAWVLLLEGRDAADPLILQAKEAQASVLEAHLAPSAYANHGERVVEGQRAIQASSDILLGWQRVREDDGMHRDFYVRQLWDGKGSLDVGRMRSDRLSGYGRLCGWTLARAHARTGDRVAIAAYLGSGENFDRAIATFAEAYAERNEVDFQALEDAVDAGRLDARLGL